MSDSVCLPAWVVDLVLPHRRQACWALLAALFRFGTERVVEGELRVYLALPVGKDTRRGSMTLMGRTQLGRNTLFRAIDDLVAIGLLHRHVSQDPSRPDGLSFPVLQPEGGAKLAPRPDSEGCQTGTPTRARGSHGDGDPDPSPWPLEISEITTTIRGRAGEALSERGAELAGELAALGVSTPSLWVSAHGEELVAAALSHLERVVPPPLRSVRSRDHSGDAAGIICVECQDRAKGPHWDYAVDLEGWRAACEARGIRNVAGLLASWLAKPGVFLAETRDPRPETREEAVR